MALTNPPGSGGTAKHPPYHGGEHTSAWFATQYVHNHIPSISQHDFVQLVASIGQETHGQYTYQSIVNATNAYKADASLPSVGTKWTSHVHDVIRAAVKHGHKSWVSPFAYTAQDIPHTGGPSNIQKGAMGISSEASDIFGGLAGGLGGLLSGPILILIVIVVLILVLKK